MSDGISQEAMDINIERSDGSITNNKNNNDIDNDNMDASQTPPRLMITKMVRIIVLMNIDFI